MVLENGMLHSNEKVNYKLCAKRESKSMLG